MMIDPNQAEAFGHQPQLEQDPHQLFEHFYPSMTKSQHRQELVIRENPEKHQEEIFSYKKEFHKLNQEPKKMEIFEALSNKQLSGTFGAMDYANNLKSLEKQIESTRSPQFNKYQAESPIQQNSNQQMSMNTPVLARNISSGGSLTGKISESSMNVFALNPNLKSTKYSNIDVEKGSKKATTGKLRESPEKAQNEKKTSRSRAQSLKKCKSDLSEIETLKNKNAELERNLIEAMEQLNLEKSRLEELKSSHMKLEDLAKKLTLLAEKEKKRADELEQRVKQAQSQTGLDQIRMFYEQRIEALITKNQELRQQGSQFVAKFNQLREKVQQIPDLDRLKKKVQVYEEGLK